MGGLNKMPEHDEPLENEQALKDEQKAFELDKDTYNIEFTFSGSDKVNYKLVIHASYQMNNYIELWTVDKENHQHLLNRFTDSGMDSLWEMMYNYHTQKMLVGICDFVKMFMELKDN